MLDAGSLDDVDYSAGVSLAGPIDYLEARQIMLPPSPGPTTACCTPLNRSLDPNGTGQARWVTRWKPALNAFAVTFADRMPAAKNV